MKDPAYAIRRLLTPIETGKFYPNSRMIVMTPEEGQEIAKFLLSELEKQLAQSREWERQSAAKAGSARSPTRGRRHSRCG